MLLSEGQMSDYKGAALMLNALPPAKQLLGDMGYDANWFRQSLAAGGITACIPSNQTARSRSNMTVKSIANGTRSKTCSAGSRIGDASITASENQNSPCFSRASTDDPNCAAARQSLKRRSHGLTVGVAFMSQRVLQFEYGRMIRWFKSSNSANVCARRVGGRRGLFCSGQNSVVRIAR